MWDKEHSLTGNEYLDYLSWCEIQGIDIDGNDSSAEYGYVDNIDSDEEQQFIDEFEGDLSEETQYRKLKMKGRDKYE